MPNRDGTGPRGKGSRTGRGLGNCKTGPKIKRKGSRGLTFKFRRKGK